MALKHTRMGSCSLLVLFLLGGTAPVDGCDAGVFWDKQEAGSSLRRVTSTIEDLDLARTWPAHMRKHAKLGVENPPPGDVEPSGWPMNANATSWSATLTWEEGNFSGNVFLSTTLNVGCGGGYIGGQIWPDKLVHVDWAIWDVAGDDPNTSTRNTWPESWQCQRYDGEGFGTQCGLGPVQHTKYEWEFGTPYTFNVSLLESNATGALFGATMTNERTHEAIPIGKIFTKQPPPDRANPHGYKCDRLKVGGGSFQEYFSGGSFTNVATILGPRFRGVVGAKGDVFPTHIQDCFMHGRCYDKPGVPNCCNCHNETCVHCLPPECEVPKLTFKGGVDVQVPAEYIPPWDKNPNIKPSTACEFLAHTDTAGGFNPPHWGVPVVSDGTHDQWQCLDEHVVPCERQCCGYCLADPDCELAVLWGVECIIRHKDAKSPFVYNNNSAQRTTIIAPPRARSQAVVV